ncbi:hypothetical protein K8I85_07075 [bacterium]|nr:hypothetical protein [bacterium]
MNAIHALRRREHRGRTAAHLTILCLPLVLAPDTGATPIPAADALASWTEDQSPARGIQDGVSWTQDGAEIVTTANADGALISDFPVPGEFEYSVRIEAIDTPYDDDTVGLVFGYGDHRNHYRLGWEAGGSPDGSASGESGGTGATGLWFVVEESEVGTILFNIPGLFRPAMHAYVFRVGRTGATVYFDIAEEGGSEVASYSVADTTFATGSIGFYSESQRARYGSMDLTASATAAPVVPWAGDLAVVGPNPFRNSTALRFDVPAAAALVARIFDVRGRRVRDLADEIFPAGRHHLSWDGSGSDGRRMAPGVYFVAVDGAGVHAARKLVLIR